MKTRCIERNISLDDLEEFLEDEEEFFKSSYEVLSEEKKCNREIQDLNYIDIKKLGIRVHNCAYEIYDESVKEYLLDSSFFSIINRESNKILYQEFNCSVTDAIYNYLSYINDEESLDDFDYITCNVIIVEDS